MKIFLLIISILTILPNAIMAQDNLPNKIIISRGFCTKTCGYDYTFSDIQYKNQIEFDLRENKYRFRRKINKPFKEICYNESNLLLNKEIYYKLEELYKKFEKMPIGAGKYYIFRIELVYFEEKMKLPSKIKAMEFLHTDFNDNTHPEVLSDLVKEYKNIIRMKKSF